MVQPFRTGDRILTLATFVTILGFVLVCGGIALSMYNQAWLGLSCIIGGRLCDNLDGWLARKYGMVSSFGAKLDTIADKLGILLIALYLLLTASDARTQGLLYIVMGIQMLIALFALGIKLLTRQELVVTRTGKHAMFTISGGLALMLFAEALGPGSVAPFIKVMSQAVLLAGFCLSVVALIQYMNERNRLYVVPARQR